VVDFAWIFSGKPRHRLDGFPIGYRHELAFGLTVLAKAFDAERFFLQRLYADLVEVFRVFVGALALYPPAPDAGDPDFYPAWPCLRLACILMASFYPFDLIGYSTS
jgi:hypothetical protein